jgi:phage baseplate assembly protein W
MIDFGTDLSLRGGLTGKLISGLELFAESIARRIRCPRGSCFYDPDYGTSLLEFLGESLDDEGAGMCAVLESEVEDDPRVLTANFTVTVLTLRSVELRCELTTVAGPLALVISVDQAAQTLTPNIEVVPYGVG